MSSHINRISLRRCNHRIKAIKIGCFVVLVLGAWFLGIGLGKIQNSHAETHTTTEQISAKRSTNSASFHPNAISDDLQGSYVTYLPLHAVPANLHYQIASLVHIKGDKIYQQFLLVPKHLHKPSKTHRIHIQPRHVIKYQNHHKKSIHYSNKINNYKTIQPDSNKMRMKQIINAVRSNPYYAHLASTLSNLNAESTTGNIKQANSNGQYTIRLRLHQYTYLSDYTPRSLKIYFGSSMPYVLPPSNWSKAKLNFNEANGLMQCNGFTYHQITKKRAEKLIHEANGKLFFNGY